MNMTLQQVIEENGGMEAFAGRTDLSIADLASICSLIGITRDGNGSCDVYSYADGESFLIVAACGLVIESECPTLNDQEYTLEISKYNSADIRRIAEKAGVETMKLIGEGHSDGDLNNCNSRVSFFELSDGMRVADTNGDPIWEDEDASIFAELAESCDVEI